MNPLAQTFENRRILVIDDEPSMHRDFASVLSLGPQAGERARFAELDAGLFGGEPAAAPRTFSVEHAFQGRDGVALARGAMENGRVFSVAFVDMRMPPGWDGLRTITELWKLDPRLHVVICTAYSDHPWRETLGTVAAPDQLLIVKKPFDPVEVLQAATMMCGMWKRARESEERIQWLETAVHKCEAALVVPSPPAAAP